MKYYSTNHQSPEVSFREALLKGQAPDRGLYMPVEIPAITEAEISSFSKMEYDEIAYTVIRKFLGGDIPDPDLRALCHDAYNFQVPLEHVTDRRYVMRLDQGPTASFKDFAARMMGRMMNYFLKKENRKLLILTATSGDTGSAIANAFLGLDNIEVVILFPENEVTSRQRKQMTTLGQNVHVMALDGKFDDCQALVKEAFADPDLGFMNLSSANSINIGRLVPQSVYYFYAFSRLRNEDPDDKAVFCVPSGNFGDMMGGMLAMKMGLPVKRFLIAVNENDEFPKYLHSGIYEKIEPSKNCISSAMNVGHPSNLTRLLALYGGVMDEKGHIHQQADLDTMRKELWSVTVDNTLTRSTIKMAWSNYRLLLEPHGAVGWSALQQYFDDHPEVDFPNQLCVSLETAHPAKFPDEIRDLLSFEPDLPSSLAGIEEAEEYFEYLTRDYKSFKSYLLSKFNS
jgi:threonine synthase